MHDTQASGCKIGFVQNPPTSASQTAADDGFTPRVLVLMRHGRAEAMASRDSQRHLTDRGRTDARAAGVWLASALEGLGHSGADLALVSTAERTRETWDAVSESVTATRVRHDDGVYGGSFQTVLDLIAEAGGDAAGEAPAVQIVVGHNPLIAQLAQLLQDGEGDERAAAQLLAHGFAPGSAVLFTCADPWSELGPGGARLVDYFTPAGGPE